MSSENTGSGRLEYIVTESDAEKKLNAGFLLRRRLGVSEKLFRRMKWVEDGILLDGVRVTSDVTPAAGRVLSIRLGDPVRRSGIIPVPGPLDIVYEDRDIVVLNKAPGTPVHPGPGHYLDTVGNYLLCHYDLTGETADFHPVHRLDAGTSGLMVAAKHPCAQERLRSCLHTDGFVRTYLAVCEGVPCPPSGVVDAPIGPKENSLCAQHVTPGGRAARTGYRVLKTANGLSLVELKLETGRTHQIRVHMSYIGCPLAGDALYGRASDLIARPALHSHSLRLRQPMSGKTLVFTQPLPEDMAALLRLPADERG